MEFWEREYLKTLDEIERNKSLSKRKKPRRKRETIDKLWEEVIQEDGTKIYVPNQAAYLRSKRQKRLRASLFKGLKFLIKFLLIIAVLLLLLGIVVSRVRS